MRLILTFYNKTHVNALYMFLARKILVDTSLPELEITYNFTQK